MVSSSLPPSPSKEEINRAEALYRPLERLLAPHFSGWEQIPPTKPLLFVGNHTIYGVLDVPFLILGLHRERGIFVRTLGDHIHFAIPVWGELLQRYGVVDGNRESCGALMRAGEAILVFPGGAREVAKRRGEKYQLIWGRRLGFVKMAMRHGATIVPFAALGADDALDVLLDADDLLASPLGKVLRRLNLREDAILPLVKGIGPTPIPRPERLYFRFMPPVDTRRYAGQHDDEERCKAVRAEVAQRIEKGISELRMFRRGDPKRGLLPRLTEALAVGKEAKC